MNKKRAFLAKSSQSFLFPIYDANNFKDKERGDASRVLVLAATNMPWAIDDAARRRFVRRQYIPLPERETRAVQLKTLLGHQKHSLTDEEFEKLVDMTDGKLFRSLRGGAASTPIMKRRRDASEVLAR